MHHYRFTFLLSLIALIGSYPLAAQADHSASLQSEADSVTAPVELTTLKVQYLLNRSNPVAPLPKEVLPTTLLLQAPLSSAVSVISTDQAPELREGHRGRP